MLVTAPAVTSGGRVTFRDVVQGAPLRAIGDIQHWSNWRHLHQGQARHSHYQRRLAAEPDP